MIFMFRRRTFFTILILCALLVAASCLVIMNSQVLTTPTISWQMAEHTFLVDPGHGGTFPGSADVSAGLFSAGTADPLNQRATVGWKATKVSKVLVDDYLVRIMSAATPEQ